MSAELPVAKPTTLIVLVAFDHDAEGVLRPAFAPRQMMSERRAMEEARMMTARSPAVVVWERTARPDEGEYGEPRLLFHYGWTDKPMSKHPAQLSGGVNDHR
jgi:hypothetical protein